ncbi:hypothetical protein [Streptosporangium sp. CA-115845]|uniref:hypothetical protein n=1 Tax=Streptosporangium sp. CA-115845 TaxID=3240071 RepID=UPI003D8EA81F
MKKARITTGHVSAVVALPDGLDTAAACAASRSLPGGWQLGPHGSASQVAVEVTIGAANVVADPHTVRLWLPRQAATSATLAYATYTALERVRQQQRMVTVHATALHTPAGAAVLLLGAKGSGKTTTALALAERGWLHAGDDLVVLAESDDGGLAVWPGKPTAAVRDPLQALAPKPLRDLEPFAADPAPLVWIVRLAVHPSGPAASLTSAVPLSANERLRLHEGLARYISGLPTPLTGTASAPYGPVWPLDTPACARWRTGLIAALNGHRFDYLYAPTPDAAADLLAKEAS